MSGRREINGRVKIGFNIENFFNDQRRKKVIYKALLYCVRL